MVCHAASHLAQLSTQRYLKMRNIVNTWHSLRTQRTLHTLVRARAHSDCYFSAGEQRQKPEIHRKMMSVLGTIRAIRTTGLGLTGQHRQYVNSAHAYLKTFSPLLFFKRRDGHEERAFSCTCRVSLGRLLPPYSFTDFTAAAVTSPGPQWLVPSFEMKRLVTVGQRTSRKMGS